MKVNAPIRVRVKGHRLVRMTGAGDIIGENTSGEGGELANILQKQNRQSNTDYNIQIDNTLPIPRMLDNISESRTNL